jgi:putative membrane protein
VTGLLLRLAIGAVGLWVASALVSGIHVDGPGTLVLAALVLGLVNALVRPIAVLLTLPITVLTLGLFLWVVNAAMLGLTAWLLPSFHIDGFGAALLGALVVGLVSWVASWYVGPRGRVEVLIVRR